MTSSGAPQGDVVWEGDKLPRASQHFPKHTTTDAKTQLASQPAANKPNPVAVKHSEPKAEVLCCLFIQFPANILKVS